MKLLNTLLIGSALVGSCYADRVLSNDEAATVIKNTAQKLREGYVFVEESEKLSQSLLTNLENNKYQNLTESELANRITKDMRATVNDGHLYAIYQKPIKTKTVKLDPKIAQRFHRDELKAKNYGWERYEILPGGVGYVENTGFLGEEEAFERATLMMNLMSKCAAIIIDLRKNGGGDGRMGHVLASYFFHAGHNKWLLSNDNRQNGTHVQEWSLPYVPGVKMPNTPLYILTSKGTFSAAEAFAYAMKSCKRATIVGENSGGGAHSGCLTDVGFDIKVFIPSGRVTSPITKSNWEGVGVKVDIACEQEKAVECALLHFFEEKSKSSDKYESDSGKWYVDYFRTTMRPIKYPAENLLTNCVGSFDGGRAVVIENGRLHYVTPGGVKLELAYLKGDTFYGIGPNVSQQYGGLRITFKGFHNAKVDELSMAIKNKGIKPPNCYSIKRVQK